MLDVVGEIAISIDKVSSLSTPELSMTNEIDVDSLGLVSLEAAHLSLETAFASNPLRVPMAKT